MYLLDLEKCDLERGWLKLREFTDCNRVEYAILSHRWTADEVMYSDIESENAKEKGGFVKVRGAVNQAREDGYSYLWIDARWQGN